MVDTLALGASVVRRVGSSPTLGTKLTTMNLIIGDTSQISKYFPLDFIRISSRNIDFDFIKSRKWDKIYICFGESRKYIENTSLHDEINYKLTLHVIDNIKDYANKIYYYSTCELWNLYSGGINISMEFNYIKTPYTDSKYKITKHILDNYELYSNVIILYPFNFNSIHRSKEFLFGKIFNSITNKIKIEIGDTYFYRDIIHPKYVVLESLKCESHKIIGSGRLTFVNDFIKDLYKKNNMNYDEFVVESLEKFNEYNIKQEYYLKSVTNLYSYNELLIDTNTEILNNIKNFS